MPKNTEDMDPKMAAMMKMFASLPPDVAQPLVGVTQPLIDAAIAKMEAQHGTVLEYIKQELAVSDDDLVVLRQKYLQ
jgi:protein-tyrosine phosphatase